MWINRDHDGQHSLALALASKHSYPPDMTFNIIMLVTRTKNITTLAPTLPTMCTHSYR